MATNAIDCYVKLPSGKTMTFILNSHELVETVYIKVAEELNVPAARVLIKYTGKIVDRTRTVGYLGICKETILKAEVIQIQTLNIVIKLEDGKTLPLSIENISPIKYITEHIQDKEGIEPNMQCLKIGARTLRNQDEKCMDAGITDETVLSLQVRSPATKTETEDKNGNISQDDKEVVMGSFDAAGKPVEVVFSFDTTGSMYSCLEQVRLRLKDTVTRLIHEVPHIRIGLIAHGDYLDFRTYVASCQDFTTDVDVLQTFVQDAGRTMGGGDGGECYEWVLHKAQALDWSEESAKALVMIGDDLPHVVSFTDQRINWQDELDVLMGLGVKVYGVQAEHGRHSAPFFRELAERTGGAYINFTNFSIIADMFLAVCYKQASQQQFEEFQAEVTSEFNSGSSGAADVKAVLQQIEDSEQKMKEETEQGKAQERPYIAAPWWDPALDHGTPQYRYNADTDNWARWNAAPARTSGSAVSTPASIPAGTANRTSSLRSRFSFRRKSRSSNPSASHTSHGEKKKTCVVM